MKKITLDLEGLKSQERQAVLKVQSEIFMSIRDFLREQGFIEIFPPILAPSTDPGIRGASRAKVNYYGREYFLTTSMILYKQVMISVFDKIYAFSPNIRLEPESSHSTGRHLCEFWQVDLEVRNADCKQVMGLGELLLVWVCRKIKKSCDNELKILARELRVPKPPFEKIEFREALEILDSKGLVINGSKEIPWEAEEALSRLFKEPFWIVNYPYGSRGFYDRQDEKSPNFLVDFDLIYPEGYGEAISGGEREYKYEKVRKKIKDFGNDPKEYRWYLEFLKKGGYPSAGFGIGVERLTRYICGLKRIEAVTPFPRVPGEFSP